MAGIHVLSFLNKTAVRLGRGHDADVRISDISVSRLHASIHYIDGEFVLEDNESKFGSLLLAREPVMIRPGQSAHLQVGRSVFSIDLFT